MKNRTIFFFNLMHDSPPAHFKDSNDVVVMVVSFLVFKLIFIKGIQASMVAQMVKNPPTMQET